MREIEAGIVRDPFAHPVVKGLGGATKMRVARPGTGKSGGGRVLYFLAIGAGTLAMLTAYAKNVQEDLSPSDRRAILRTISMLLDGETK